MPRFSINSILVAIAVAAMLLALNTRQSKSTTEPFYASLKLTTAPPPPVQIRRLARAVNHDRGWPIWHTRATEHIAIHQHELEPYLGGVEFQDISATTNLLRAGFDFAVAVTIVILSIVLSEWANRRVRRQPPLPDSSGTGAQQSADPQKHVVNRIDRQRVCEWKVLGGRPVTSFVRRTKSSAVGH